MKILYKKTNHNLKILKYNEKFKTYILKIWFQSGKNIDKI